MFIPIDRRKVVFWSTFGDYFEVKGSPGRSSCTGTHTGENHLVDVANLDQSGLFGDKEDVTLKKEEIALNGFEVGFETWVSVSARRGLDYVFRPGNREQTFGSFLNR